MKSLERLARRAAGGDVEAALELFIQVGKRSDKPMQAWAIIKESRDAESSHFPPVYDSEIVALKISHPAALEDAARRAYAVADDLYEVQAIREGMLPELAPMIAAFDGGDFGAALNEWNEWRNTRVRFWIHGPTPIDLD